MKPILILALGAAALSFSVPAFADPNKDESGHDRWRGEYERSDRYYRYDDDRKVKFRTRDGCEVERKWKRGEYEEKVKCKRRDRD